MGIDRWFYSAKLAREGFGLFALPNVVFALLALSQWISVNAVRQQKGTRIISAACTSAAGSLTKRSIDWSWNDHHGLWSWTWIFYCNLDMLYTYKRKNPCCFLSHCTATSTRGYFGESAIKLWSTFLARWLTEATLEWWIPITRVEVCSSSIIAPEDDNLPKDSLAVLEEF